MKLSWYSQEENQITPNILGVEEKCLKEKVDLNTGRTEYFTYIFEEAKMDLLEVEGVGK